MPFSPYGDLARTNHHDFANLKITLRFSVGRRHNPRKVLIQEIRSSRYTPTTKVGDTMPTFTTEVYDEALGHSFESTIESSNEEKGKLELKIRVPPDSPLLVLTVSDLDPYVADRGPSRIYVDLRPPADAKITPSQTVTEGGTIVYVIERPPQGTWTVFVEYGPNASAKLKASAFGERFWERLRMLRRGAACKSCKVFLKAAVETAILAFVLHTLPAAAVAGAIGGTLQAFCGRKTIEAGWEKILEILLGYADTPLDTMVHKICSLARACASEG